MTFLVYEADGGYLVKTGLTFSLAGYNLIYHIWESRQKPTDQGWHITRDDLASSFDLAKKAKGHYRFVVDFDPNATWRIGLIELLDIYIYTYAGSENGKAGWSPMMLRFKDLIYEEFKDGISVQEKEERISRIAESNVEGDFVEFLYLNGSDKGWNWGMNGMTNAAFIQEPARTFFRQYF